jgi:hypothetical protein
LDIYIDFDEETFSKVELKVNYAGKIYNHGFVKPTPDTINATDKGIYDEDLIYSYIDLNSNYIINNQF